MEQRCGRHRLIGGGVMGTAHGKSVRFCLKNGLIDGEFVGIAESDPAPRELRDGIGRSLRDR